MKNICNQKNINKRKLRIQKIPRQLFLYSDTLRVPHDYVIQPNQQVIIQNNYKVQSLKISNQYAQIQWKNGVDLSQMNYYCLADILDFGPNYIQVYRNNNWTPQQGQQLNKQCIVTFHNGRELLNNYKQRPQKFLKKLQKQCRKKGIELLVFDYMTGEWKVKIFHFTRYSFNDDGQQNELQQQRQQTTKRVRKSTPKKQKINSSISQIPQKQQLQTETRAYEQEQEMLQLSQNFTKQININQSELKKINDLNFKIHPRLSNIEFENLAFGGNGYIFNFFRNSHSYKISAVEPKPVKESEISHIITFINENKMLNIQNLNHDLLDKLPKSYRRILKLIKILFEDNIHQPLSYKKQQQFKTWLEDIIKQIQIKSQYPPIKFLAKRQLLQLQNYYISQNKSKEAQIATLLEDQTFRYCYKFNYKLPIELQFILKQCISMFNDENWFVNLGIVIWYFINDPFDQRLYNFFKNPQNFPKGLIYFREWEILKLYTSEKKKIMNNESEKQQQQMIKNKEQDLINNDKTSESLVLDWIVSNHLAVYQQSFYREKEYTTIKINIVRNLIYQVSDPRIKLLIVKCDQTLNNQQKNLLMKQIATREPQKFQALSNFLDPDIKMHFDYGKGISYLYKYQNKQCFHCLKDVRFREQCDSNKLIQSELVQIISNTVQIKQIQYLDKQIEAGTFYQCLKSYLIYFKLYQNKILLDLPLLNKLIYDLKSHKYFQTTIGPFLIQKLLKHQRDFRIILKNKQNKQIINQLIKFAKDKKIESRLKLLTFPL